VPRPAPDPPTHPVESARAAGLRYVNDRQPGITREMGPLGWVFRAPDGSRITDEAEISRILTLGIPPAWTDVWISPVKRGHIQATGRDARGRKQYRYHPRWREVRDEAKYGRLIEFARGLPRMRRRTDRDLRVPDCRGRRCSRLVVQLLEETLIRVGNDEYARDNRRYGLSTLRDRHVRVTGRGRWLRVPGQGRQGARGRVPGPPAGPAREAVPRDPGPRAVPVLRRGRAGRSISSGDVNDYLREISGQDFTAKDFRTWFGTVLAARALQGLDVECSESQAKKNLVQAIEAVAGLLGNTRSVCRKCYVHPAIVDSYLDRSPNVTREGFGLRASGFGPCTDLAS
jgi:DNA topoisomerase I